MKLLHVIESQQFTVPLLMELFARTREMERVVARGGTRDYSSRVMASLFYEPSTRTRFSFEAAMYQREGVDVRFVGHPLIDLVQPRRTRDEFLAGLRLDPAAPVVDATAVPTLEELGFTEEIIAPYVAVKEAVFPFAKFREFDPILGPEMRSTGEVMGIADSFGMAFAKAELAAGNGLPLEGMVMLTVNDQTGELVDLAQEKVFSINFKDKSYKVKTFAEMRARPDSGYEPLAFIDDDPAQQVGIVRRQHVRHAGRGILRPAVEPGLHRHQTLAPGRARHEAHAPKPL